MTSLTRSICQPLTRAITDAGTGGFSPASLYTGGIKGITLDLTDMTQLYQDSARTTLVTATGQPIGSPSDLSGNGIHPTQATAAARPTFNGYATFDGTDDGWATPAIDMTGTDKVTVVMAIQKTTDASLRMALEFGTAFNTPGSFYVTAPDGASATHAFNLYGTGQATFQATGAAFGTTRVVSAQFDIAGAAIAQEIVTRINGATPSGSATNAGPAGTGNFGSNTLNIGRRSGGTLPLHGRIYRLIVVGRALTAVELAAAERWCAAGAGVTL